MAAEIKCLLCDQPLEMKETEQVILDIPNLITSRRGEGSICLSKYILESSSLCKVCRRKNINKYLNEKSVAARLKHILMGNKRGNLNTEDFVGVFQELRKFIE